MWVVCVQEETRKQTRTESIGTRGPSQKAKDRSLRMKPTLRHRDVGLQPPEPRKYISSVWAPQSVVLFFQPEQTKTSRGWVGLYSQSPAWSQCSINIDWWEWRYWPLRKWHCGPSGFHRLLLHMAGVSCPTTPFHFWAWNVALGPVSVLGTMSYTSIWEWCILCGGRSRRETECGLGNCFFKIIFSLK